jgi:hypothetical protein
MAVAPFARLDGDDHRQHFRREADRHRDRKQQRFEPVVLGQAIDQKDQRPHHHDEADHQQREAVDALVEGGRNVPAGDLVSQLTEKCLRAGAHDDAGGVAADDVGAHEADVRQVERIVETPVAGVRIFLGRHRFAGERRLVDEQILRFEEPQVRRYHVAGGQPHHIARHQRLNGSFGEIDRPGRAAAPHTRRRLHHRS